MLLPLKLVYTFGVLMLSVLYDNTKAEMAGDAASNGLPSGPLYELQREYAGPVLFPNHQVERKAQRSPSLRLRFGRRSDPEVALAAQKRWFGDVRQKPIRSPSLRLRFGRRSDPSVPVHSSWDALMSDLVNTDNNLDDYSEDVASYESGFERVARKPQRLRWGRSVPYNNGETDVNGEMKQRYDELFASLLNAEKLRTMLAALQYEANNNNNEADDENVANDLDLESGEFQREVRKPGPLRLRWGRSTGGRKPNAAADEQSNGAASSNHIVAGGEVEKAALKGDDKTKEQEDENNHK